MTDYAHRHRIFAEGHAFQTADGVIYRVRNAVTVNGVDLVVYEIIRARSKPEPTATPVREFARMLEEHGAVLCRDPLE